MVVCCWSGLACCLSRSFVLETPRCGSRLLAQWRSRSLGSAAYSLAEPAIGQGDALGLHLVLDRELQLLEPRDQHFIGSNLALFALNLGVETGMLAPKIVQVIVGHRHLHAKVEDVRAQAGAPDRIGTLPVGFQQLRTHQSARAAPRSVRARRQPDPFARKKQIATDRKSVV